VGVVFNGFVSSFPLAKTLLELMEGSTVTKAQQMFVDTGLGPLLSGSEALTLLAPQDDAFKGPAPLLSLSLSIFVCIVVCYIVLTLSNQTLCCANHMSC
jgi:small neutral amino acid transporter SnatA (MarC family)